jgi:3-hydroxyethyl bacteriochlorophyllide a dehydrogenase
MNMKTHAIVIAEPQHVELREVELTTPGPDDVIVRTAYTAISAGTERMLLAGRLPHPMLRFPIVPGYETVGKIVARGANVPPELEDSWVYVGGARCFVDVNPAWGGQSATLIVDHQRVVPLGAIDPHQGVLLALAATALHGIDLLGVGGGWMGDGIGLPALSLQRPTPGKRILVLGQGPVGQIAARLARAQGGYVAVTDRVASRLERSVADLKVSADDPQLPDLLKPPFDVIIEATGSMIALAEALPALANGGTILLLGYYDELRLPYMPLFLKQARLLTAREWAPGDLARCRDMLADGSLDVRGLITHHMPIAQVAQAYDLALNDSECLKMVLDWS